MTINAVDLHRLAESMGVTLQRHNGGKKGWYDHATRTISTRRGMSIQQYRSVLAHELGHAHYGDTPTGNGHFDQRQERRADEYAARLLISPVEFEAAATWHHGHLPAIADELEVTKHLLKTWQSLHERTAA
ncbi:ImmA/IrrE family metallo-endopeptidase [Corynebacterium guaraldiae]